MELPSPGDKAWGDLVSAEDEKKWCGQKSLRDCLMDVMYGGSYGADRINTVILWDEPIFAMASFLDLDTVQMTMSANSAGFWQYEILDVRYAKYQPGVSNRDYSSFIIGPDGMTNPFDLSFSPRIFK